MFNIPPAKKKTILPIFDVAEFFKDAPENSFDHEDRKPPKTVDEHLAKFIKRIKLKWGFFECFVDLRHVDASCRLADGLHPVTFVFNGLRFCRVEAIPVVGIDRDEAFRAAVLNVIKSDNRGFCLRANLDRAIGSDFSKAVANLLVEMNGVPHDCDFILDLGAPDKFEPLADFTNIVENVIKNLPFLNEWRSFGLIGHSMPASLSKQPLGLSTLPRNEWILYKKLIKRLKSHGIRVPIFGDYAINHPTAQNFNNKAIPSKACVRYTISDGWLISKGEEIWGRKGKKGLGLDQYVNLCNLIVNSEYYCGRSFSLGDEYIMQCADKNVKPGQQSRFRQVGTSHHLEMVMRDLASLDAS